jgi:hypothetical protein
MYDPANAGFVSNFFLPRPLSVTQQRAWDGRSWIWRSRRAAMISAVNRKLLRSGFKSGMEGRSARLPAELLSAAVSS